MPYEVVVNGKKFELVKIQRDGVSAIYKRGDVFVRMGKSDRIRRDITLHKEMLSGGFPLANIIEEGETNGMTYFMEESLGDKNFSALFTESLENNIHPSDEVFEKFLSVVERFLRAQVATTSERNFTEVEEGVMLNIICDELPEDAEQIRSRFKEAVTALQNVPFVVSHGDFNPHNIHERGVIDLEDSFHAPAGYDAVCAIEHIEFFPLEEGYEFQATYRFSEEQKRGYYELVDGLHEEHGTMLVSPLIEHLRFMRAVWSAVRMHQWPKIREWRFTKLKNEFF